MPTINKQQKKRKNESSLDEERKKIYQSERWRRLRAIKFAANPLCEICQKKGIATPTEDIHHIISFVGVDDTDRRYRLAYDYDNLMSLCKKCHQEIHNKKPHTL